MHDRLGEYQLASVAESVAVSQADDERRGLAALIRGLQQAPLAAERHDVVFAVHARQHPVELFSDIEWSGFEWDRLTARER